MQSETGETGFVDEPAGVDFVAVFAAVDGIAFVVSIVDFFVFEIDVFKEGAGAGLF